MTSNIAPIDLTDEVAVRLHLQTSGGGFLPTTNAVTLPQVTKEALFKTRVIDNLDLKKYVQDRVAEFDKEMGKVINEVEYNLKDTDYKTVILSTELATNYATITEIAGVYATQSAVGAIYGVEVNANGHVAGYKSIATGTASVFQIYAEKFAVSSSSTQEGYSPFQIDTVNHKINMTSNVAIDGNLLVSGTVTADSIAGNTISGITGQFSGTSYYTVDGRAYSLTNGRGFHSENNSGYGVVGKSSNDHGGFFYTTSTSTSAVGVVGTNVNGGNAVQGVASTGNFGLYTAQNGYIGGTTYPFTGAHYTFMKVEPTVGDIIISTDAIGVRVDQSFSYAEPSSVAMDSRVFGVANYSNRDLMESALRLDDFSETVDGERVIKPEFVDFIDNLIFDGYSIGATNSIGEGMINVCSDGGDIYNGYYICSSNTVGKGMKQADDILHNYTVAKALEDVVWANETLTTKMIACTYHCG